MKRENISSFLIDQGASFLEKDYRGWNSLFYCCYYKEYKTFDKIKDLCESSKFLKIKHEKDIFSKTFDFYSNLDD